MKKLFEAKNINKYFGENKVLNNINLDLYENEVVSILGPSGSGKSTLLRCLALLEKIDSGQIFLENKKIVDVNINIKKDKYISNNDLKEVRNCLGFVFQDFNLFPHYNVFKNISDAAIYIHKKNKEKIMIETENLLKKFGLYDKKDFYPCELSGGQKQRVAIARALILKPKIIFFDEPTSALDLEITDQVLKILKDIAIENITMLIVTHEIDFAKNISDRIIFMDSGSIIETGQDIIDNPKHDRTKLFLKKYKT